MKKKTILVVDDDPTIILYVGEVLSAHGFRMISATDGEEGIALATAEHPELILLDLVMPKMNGFEAARILRRNPRTERIPIIALTSLDSPGDCERAFLAGCNDHLQKPLERECLLAKISSVLRLSRL